MPDAPLTADEFDRLKCELLGLPVALAWKGYGSAIFLELGALSPAEQWRGEARENGEACIKVEWDWRIELGRLVLIGSSNSGPDIAAGIEQLAGESVVQIAVDGEVPELTVGFSSGARLRSMVMTTGDPQWAIRLRDGRWVSARRGRLELDAAVVCPMSVSEEAASDREKEAAGRWGRPSLEPVLGRCSGCQAFIPLDGDAWLHNYGCCISAASPFDGRAVHRSESGCPEFTLREDDD